MNNVIICAQIEFYILMFSKWKISSFSTVVGIVIQVQHLKILQIIDIDYEFLREIQQCRNSFCVLTFLHISTAFLDLLTRLTI